jgi:hypothetical protein
MPRTKEVETAPVCPESKTSKATIPRYLFGVVVLVIVAVTPFITLLQNNFQLLGNNTIRKSQTSNLVEYDDSVLDSSQVKTVYRLGHDKPYGRFNNHLKAFLRAIDIAWINSCMSWFRGKDARCQERAIVAVSGWASDMLKDLFFNETSELEWALQMEKLSSPVLFVHESRLPALRLSSWHKKKFIDLNAKKAFHFSSSKTWRKLPLAIMKERRQAVYGKLLPHVSQQNFLEYQALTKFLVEEKKQKLPLKYVAIHSRWLEGGCISRVGKHIRPYECFMNATYIKDIIHASGAQGLPIVFFSDGQNPDVLKQLQDDTEIGPHLIDIPSLMNRSNITRTVNAIVNDFMVGVHSEVFIGTRASTMASNIGLARVLSGADPASNYIFVQHGPSQGSNYSSSLNVCGDCIFYCPNPQDETTGLCGRRNTPG